MKRFAFWKIFILLAVLCFTMVNRAFSQNYSAAFARADTSRFSPNLSGGWQLFNSYVTTYQGTGATLELVIQHANNIDWTTENYVGKISYKPLQPSNEQRISFNFSSNNYMLRINNTGKCYLKLANGALPVTDPFVIPLKIFYQLQ